MAVVIDQVEVTATAPPAQTRSGQGGGSDAGQASSPGDVQKAIEKILAHRESRMKRLQAY